MGRRSQTVAAVVVLLALLGLPIVQPLTNQLFAGASAQTPTDNPNIVIIQYDDMRSTDWQALGTTEDLLLGSGGTRFPNYFATTPLCCPSRASLLTGLYAHNHRVLRNDGRNGGWQAFRRRERETLATWLNRAGYRTGLVGKYFNGFTDTAKTPPGWDRMWATSELNYYNFGLNENGKWVSYKKKKGRQQRYVTDVLKSKAVQFIRGTDETIPIFLYVGMRAPHNPSTPAKRHRKRFPGAQAKYSEAFNEPDVSDKPGYVKRIRPLDARAVRRLDQKERQRLQTLVAADQMFADIWQTLATTGRLENTYIFVLSDNGQLMGEHRLKKKGAPYDMSTRIPMIAWGNGFAGGDDPRLVGNIDIAPTIVDIVGLDVPSERDGVSLLSGRERTGILLESFSFNRSGYRAIRTRQHLYVRYLRGGVELYDYRDDPHELTNLAGKGLAVEAELDGRLDALIDCDAAECFEEGQPP